MIPDLHIPLFPLGLVLYPGEQTLLHIFEPRYREMVAYCLEEEKPFGIVWQHEGAMAEVGCTAQIEQVVRRYEDGRLDIQIRGAQRFYVREVLSERAYLLVEPGFYKDAVETPDTQLRQRVIAQHMRLLELANRTVRPSAYENAERLSYIIAPNAGMTAQQKQEVLELQSENQRIAYLIKHLEAFIPRLEQEEKLRRLIISNGHLKDFPSEET